VAVVIGTSGWQYDDWNNVLYSGVPRKRWLEHYATVFPAVEVNNTFYNLPKSSTFEGWAKRTPEAFVFVCKASRYLTHIRRLNDPAEPITRFVERVRLLGEKLGPALYQLPPSLKRDDELLKNFLHLLPSQPKAAIEFRHQSWYDPEVYAALRDSDVALVIADSPKHKTPFEQTTSWGYIRLHGGEDETSYGGEALGEWARRIAGLAGTVDPIYVFFNNDKAGNAVIDGLSLTEKVRALGVPVTQPPDTGILRLDV
jgi:uncharacterized protein YecE (DUF72 family)